jgi:hypothetical protein
VSCIERAAFPGEFRREEVGKENQKTIKKLFTFKRWAKKAIRKFKKCEKIFIFIRWVKESLKTRTNVNKIFSRGGKENQITVKLFTFKWGA